MGNFITTIGTIPLPLIIQEVVIPFVMHPHRWGGIPFTPPGPFQTLFMYIVFTLTGIGLLATLSGMMTTARQCQKVQLWTAFRNSRYPMFFGLLGMILVTVIPTVKFPLLMVMPRIPFASVIVSGIYIAILVMIGGMIANNKNLEQVCTNSKTTT